MRKKVFIHFKTIVMKGSRVKTKEIALMAIVGLEVGLEEFAYGDRDCPFSFTNSKICTTFIIRGFLQEFFFF